MAVRDKIKYDPDKVHKLKSSSSFIVVTLKSTACRVCICCGKPIKSFEEACEHWNFELDKAEKMRTQQSEFEF